MAHNSSEISDIFSASSSAVFGTTNGRLIRATLKGDQILGVNANDPGKELLHLPIASAYERVAASAIITRQQLHNIYVEHQEQSKNWFRASILAACSGFFVLLVGIFCLFAGQNAIGIFSTVAGVVPEIIAGLFYRQANLSNQMLQLDQSKLIEAERIHQMIDLVLTIEDSQLRDKLKTSILKAALRDSFIKESNVDGGIQ